MVLPAILLGVRPGHLVNRQMNVRSVLVRWGERGWRWSWEWRWRGRPEQLLVSPEVTSDLTRWQLWLAAARSLLSTLRNIPLLNPSENLRGLGWANLALADTQKVSPVYQRKEPETFFCLICFRKPCKLSLSIIQIYFMIGKLQVTLSSRSRSNSPVNFLLNPCTEVRHRKVLNSGRSGASLIKQCVGF